MHEPIARHKTVAVDRSVALDRRRASARLLDDHHQRGDIPRRDSRVDGDLARTFSDEDMLPEVAEATIAVGPPARDDCLDPREILAR